MLPNVEQLYPGFRGLSSVYRGTSCYEVRPGNALRETVGHGIERAVRAGRPLPPEPVLQRSAAVSGSKMSNVFYINISVVMEIRGLCGFGGGSRDSRLAGAARAVDLVCQGTCHGHRIGR